MTTRPPDQRDQGPAPDEQEESDLQSFLRNASAWFDRYGTSLLIGLLVVAITVFAVQWYSGREQRALEAAYTDLALATSPLGKQRVAQEHDHVPGFAGKAYLEAAEILLNESMGIPTEPGQEPPEPSEEQRQENLEQAAELYQSVIDRNHSTLQVLNARFGLAAVYENLERFEDASEQYELAAEAGAETWPGIAELAEDFQGDLGRIAQPVDFPEAPEQEDAPVIPEGEGEGNLQLDLNSVPPPSGEGEGEEAAEPLPELPLSPSGEGEGDDVPDEPIIPDPDNE